MKPKVQLSITIDNDDQPIKIHENWSDKLRFPPYSSKLKIEYRGSFFVIILKTFFDKWGIELVHTDSEFKYLDKAGKTLLDEEEYKLKTDINEIKDAAILAAYLHLKVNYLLSLTNYKIEDVRENNRTKQITLLRHLLFWNLRSLKDENGEHYYSFSEIGKFFNRVNHVTVISGIEKINRNFIKRDSNTFNLVNKLGFRLP
ncbi:helix-turn-helix domain-containing protein [Dysgonomonas massiliensis]|uniref:helix-turn-helix domain-containing protein n=1 Tax=Dysgonomonas massiliensis TaxID=2040292 RepID=UPI000C76843C|nr:helix-turn-helix domain-containing protein [Dysgonomonas massiliensis]